MWRGLTQGEGQGQGCCCCCCQITVYYSGQPWRLPFTSVVLLPSQFFTLHLQLRADVLVIGTNSHSQSQLYNPCLKLKNSHSIWGILARCPRLHRHWAEMTGQGQAKYGHGPHLAYQHNVTSPRQLRDPWHSMTFTDILHTWYFKNADSSLFLWRLTSEVPLRVRNMVLA